MNVSVVVPAYNEEQQIEAVLKPVVQAKKEDLIKEVIVVDDGSEDGTARVVKNCAASVELIELPQNKGKAYAMDQGVKQANCPHILFLDADLIGLRVDHVGKMIDTYRKSDCQMVVGIFQGGRLNTDLSQRFLSSHLSGQRILPKQFWLENVKDPEGFEAEITLFGKALSRKDVKTKRIKLQGLSHVLKEEKKGLLKGLQERLKMYCHVVRGFIRSFFFE